MKHTPGPWRTDDTGLLLKIKSCEAAPRTLAVIDYQSPHLVSDAERLANAKLIAAAPDMAAALEACLAELHRARSILLEIAPHPQGHPELLAAENKARAALASIS